MEQENWRTGDTSFTGILGDSPTVKLWEFLLIGRNYEYHVKDLARGANISRPTCYVELRKFLKKGLVAKGGKSRGKQLYKLNQESPAVKAILDAFNYILYKAK
ncbi:MAG: hypothetical protein V1702_03760 [Candidatus Woesearchaeota archaeon]